MKGRNPILLGQAEVIDMVQPQVRTMLTTDGFYVGTDSEHPEFEVPLVVVRGKVYSMKIDKELPPEGFKQSLLLAGPFRGVHDDESSTPHG
ncbi:hypothetical protein [Dyella sp. 2RAB6]|uniref:hypothetical protein n=1 Tax=Dyella sp. 2RAB6 TaxID=3232992 RepID=UPI003F8DC368